MSCRRLATPLSARDIAWSAGESFGLNTVGNGHVFYMYIHMSCQHFPSISQIAANLSEAARSYPEWYKDYGLHASADAINAAVCFIELIASALSTTCIMDLVFISILRTQVPSASEMETLYKKLFLSPIDICSFGPFNMYFIITAMARAGHVV